MNTDSETHVVAVRPERLDPKGRWSLQPFTIELKGHESRQVPMIFEGDRCKGLQSGMFESEIRYHFYEGPTKPGGTRSLWFTLSVYPGFLTWEKTGTVGSCDYRWLYSANSQGEQGLYFQVYNDNIIFGMHFYLDIVLYSQKAMAGYGYAGRHEGTSQMIGPFKNPMILDRYRELASGKQPGYTVRCSPRTGT